MRLRIWGDVLLCLILSVALWLHVQGQKDPWEMRRVVVRLVPVHAPAGLYPTMLEETVEVELSGRRSVIGSAEERLRKQPLQVNLAGRKAGQAAVAPVLPALPPGVRAKLYPAAVSVNLEKLEGRKFRVHIRAVGKPRPGLVLGEPTCQPQEVTVHGVASELDRVQTVQAEVDLSSVSGGIQLREPVAAYEARGVLVATAMVEPSSVLVSVPIVATGAMPVPVEPKLEGLDLAKVEVARLEVKPAAVIARGNAKALAGLTTIPTAPIRLEGRVGSITLRVALAPPGGITVEGDKMVTVVVTLRPIVRPLAGAAPSPPSTGEPAKSRAPEKAPPAE